MVVHMAGNNEGMGGPVKLDVMGACKMPKKMSFIPMLKLFCFLF